MKTERIINYDRWHNNNNNSSSNSSEVIRPAALTLAFLSLVRFMVPDQTAAGAGILTAR